MASSRRTIVIAVLLQLALANALPVDRDKDPNKCSCVCPHGNEEPKYDINNEQIQELLRNAGLLPQTEDESTSPISDVTGKEHGEDDVATYGDFNDGDDLETQESDHVYVSTKKDDGDSQQPSGEGDKNKKNEEETSEKQGETTLEELFELLENKAEEEAEKLSERIENTEDVTASEQPQSELDELIERVFSSSELDDSGSQCSSNEEGCPKDDTDSEKNTPLTIDANIKNPDETSGNENDHPKKSPQSEEVLAYLWQPGEYSLSTLDEPSNVGGKDTPEESPPVEDHEPESQPPEDKSKDSDQGVSEYMLKSLGSLLSLDLNLDVSKSQKTVKQSGTAPKKTSDEDSDNREHDSKKSTSSIEKSEAAADTSVEAVSTEKQTTFSKATRKTYLADEDNDFNFSSANTDSKTIAEHSERPSYTPSDWQSDDLKHNSDMNVSPLYFRSSEHTSEATNDKTDVEPSQNSGSNKQGDLEDEIPSEKKDHEPEPTPSDNSGVSEYILGFSDTDRGQESKTKSLLNLGLNLDLLKSKETNTNSKPSSEHSDDRRNGRVSSIEKSLLSADVNADVLSSKSRGTSAENKKETSLLDLDLALDVLKSQKTVERSDPEDNDDPSDGPSGDRKNERVSSIEKSLLSADVNADVLSSKSLGSSAENKKETSLLNVGIGLDVLNYEIGDRFGLESPSDGESSDLSHNTDTDISPYEEVIGEVPERWDDVKKEPFPINSDTDVALQSSLEKKFSDLEDEKKIADEFEQRIQTPDPEKQSSDTENGEKRTDDLESRIQTTESDYSGNDDVSDWLDWWSRQTSTGSNDGSKDMPTPPTEKDGEGIKAEPIEYSYPSVEETVEDNYSKTTGQELGPYFSQEYVHSGSFGSNGGVSTTDGDTKHSFTQEYANLPQQSVIDQPSEYFIKDRIGEDYVHGTDYEVDVYNPIWRGYNWPSENDRVTSTTVWPTKDLFAEECPESPSNAENYEPGWLSNFWYPTKKISKDLPKSGGFFYNPFSSRTYPGRTANLFDAHGRSFIESTGRGYAGDPHDLKHGTEQHKHILMYETNRFPTETFDVSRDHEYQEEENCEENEAGYHPSYDQSLNSYDTGYHPGYSQLTNSHFNNYHPGYGQPSSNYFGGFHTGFSRPTIDYDTGYHPAYSRLLRGYDPSTDYTQSYQYNVDRGYGIPSTSVGGPKFPQSYPFTSRPWNPYIYSSHPESYRGYYTSQQAGYNSLICADESDR